MSLWEVELTFMVSVEAATEYEALNEADRMYRTGEFAQGVTEGRFCPLDDFDVHKVQ